MAYLRSRIVSVRVPRCRCPCWSCTKGKASLQHKCCTSQRFSSSAPALLTPVVLLPVIPVVLFNNTREANMC